MGGTWVSSVSNYDRLFLTKNDEQQLLANQIPENRKILKLKTSFSKHSSLDLSINQLVG